MKLQKLTLENFQGIKSLEISLPNGCSATIYGDNATGKTTTFNAMTWLLFDKASTDVKGFTPKTKSKDGDMHHLEHSVEGEFIADDGRIIRLKKSYQEVYTKKRGSNKEEFTGHSVTYEIDGVPTKEKEYQKKITFLCGGDSEKPKHLTMPNYFPERIAWDERRKLLLEICGDVSDEDVISSNPELEPLKEFLLMPGTSGQYYSPDEFKTIAQARRRTINKELAEIPPRIDELNRSMPDISAFNEDELKKGIEHFEQQQKILLAQSMLVNSPDVGIEATKANISTLKSQLIELKTDYNNKALADKLKLDKEVSDKRAEINNTQHDIVEVEIKIDDLTRKINKLIRNREEIIEEYNFVKATVWDEGQEICPTCNQKLPADEIERLKADFNLRKSRRLEDINKRGKETASKDKIAEFKAEKATLEQDLDGLNARKELLKESLEQLQASPDPTEIVPFEDTDRYASLLKDIQEQETKLEALQKRSDLERVEFDAKIRSLKEMIAESQKKLSEIEYCKNLEARIAELEERESKLGAEYEHAEQGIYLCELFTRTKVQALTEKINSKFKTVSFRLFQEQINGGLKEDCEVLVPSPDGKMVPYSFANNAARINAGLEIINVLSEHWGITMPVFIDNAEAVTHLTNLQGQTIRLVVSEPDKKLRVVLEKE